MRYETRDTRLITTHHASRITHHFFHHTVALVCLGLFAITLLVPASIGQAQGQVLRPWLITVETRMQQPVAAQLTVAPAQDAAFNLYLPIVRKPIEVTRALFAPAVSSEGVLINPQAAFDYGVTTVFASAIVQGGQGSRYLVRWSFNGVAAPSLDRTGVIVDQTQFLTTGFCNSTGNGCSAPAPIARITMVVQVFLDGVLFSEGMAVIL